MKDVDNNLHYKKHMLNLPAILDHEEERATILAELCVLKKTKWTAVTGACILCLIITETIISVVRIVSYTLSAFVKTDFVSGGPVFFANSFWMSRKPR